MQLWHKNQSLLTTLRTELPTYATDNPDNWEGLISLALCAEEEDRAQADAVEAVRIKAIVADDA